MMNFYDTVTKKLKQIYSEVRIAAGATIKKFNVECGYYIKLKF